MRLNHDLYFLVMAKVVALRSTCRSRQVGAVLTDINNYVLSTGYNGPAKGLDTCEPCKRIGKSVGEALDDCMAVHAEQNALLQCPDIRRIHTLYVTTSPCVTCLKMLFNTPCKVIIFTDRYPDNMVTSIWRDSGRLYLHNPFTPKCTEMLNSLSKIAELMP